jgi:protein-S-isoprenylcysteine O-methyltransferase Ste14
VREKAASIAVNLQALELKIPPPVVAAVAAVAMWGLSSAAPHGAAPAVRTVGAGVIGAVGVAFAASGVIAFRLARTTMNPTTPDGATALVTAGVYRLTRNPMYVGLLLLLLAWATYLYSVWALPLALLFAAYINRFQIAPEERALARLFGAAYAGYQARVRRWL